AVLVNLCDLCLSLVIEVRDELRGIIIIQELTVQFR
ncbi:unnamed protein product, partial [Tenebrio molitor]